MDVELTVRNGLLVRNGIRLRNVRTGNYATTGPIFNGLLLARRGWRSCALPAFTIHGPRRTGIAPA